MNIIIAKDSKGGVSRLTTEHSLSSYGLPVLVIEAEDVSGAFRPGDQVAPGITAASIISGWMRQPGRSKKEKEAAEKFLSQSPGWQGNKVRATFQLEPSQIEWLRRQAIAAGISQSEIIRRALAKYLKEDNESDNRA